ncbi:MAG: PTS glucose transporter subunit IIA [Mycoplasmataceae bacterium]|jgi:glucose-specific phosphotransferase system IIA component|nr:PTS glucose transporter subunit IIA [Mycoplasmataceae bacterium]
MGFLSKLFGSKETKSLIVVAPVSGEVVSTNKVKDETFSQNMVGKGFAIYPSDGNFVAPIDGEIILIAETGHAYSIKSKSGIQILVHIGLDTVNINTKRDPGAPLKVFNIIAKTGDHVKSGASIMTVDIAEIKKMGYDSITPVVVINDEYSANKQINQLVSDKTVVANTPILEIK